MTKMKKPTKRDNYVSLLNLAEVSANPTLVEFINHEIELLDKKNSADKKPTAQQNANADIKTSILNGMVNGKMYTVSELIKEIPECADLTNQRVSALVRQLKEEGKVVRIEDKRKAYFMLAD